MPLVCTLLRLKKIRQPPPPILGKKMAPKICHRMRGRMAYKSLETKGLSQRMWCTNRLLRHMNSDFYGIRTPAFMPYEPFLLGVGVVFNLLNFWVFLDFPSDRSTFSNLVGAHYNTAIAGKRAESHLPCKPIPPKFRGGDSPPKFRGRSVRNPLFYSVFSEPPP